jgi:hypothetical protein
MQQALGGTSEFWREYCPQLFIRCGNFLPDNLFHKVTPGYSSHYLFHEADALRQREFESSRGLSDCEVAGYYLIIDLDDGDSTVWEAVSTLLDSGFGFEVWNSGGKGFHLVLHHDLVIDSRLPYSHQCFVESLGIVCDLSLYHPSRIVSLPGRIHPKTGRPKRLLFQFEGDMPQIAIKEPPPRPVFNFSAQTESSKFASGLLKLHDLTLCEPKPGNRHTALWSVAMTLTQAGLDSGSVLALITKVSDTWQNQKDQESLELIVDQVSRQAPTNT